MSKLSHSNPDLDDVLTLCAGCDEPIDSPNVECWETLDILCCDDCADGFLEDHGQFGVGA